MVLLIAAILLGLADPTASPANSATPSPATTATPAAPHTLKLNIPPGWRRVESGQYNEWMNPDGSSDFRVTAMPPEVALRGPGAADIVKNLFQKVVPPPHNANLTVKTVTVCSGTEPAYRVDDALGTGLPAFMIVIPGTISTGLINYEVRPGGKDLPEIEKTINDICWP